jgi:hypothetical protein
MSWASCHSLILHILLSRFDKSIICRSQTKPKPSNVKSVHELTYLLFETALFTFDEPTMAPKPASTAGKAPASTASKVPAKTTDDKKAAKKTAKAYATGADGEKKKRRKVRKETYSSYIYKGKQSRYRVA